MELSEAKKIFILWTLECQCGYAITELVAQGLKNGTPVFSVDLQPLAFDGKSDVLLLYLVVLHVEPVGQGVFHITFAITDTYGVACHLLNAKKSPCRCLCGEQKQ